MFPSYPLTLVLGHQDIFFIVDLFLNFRTAILDDGELIQEPKQVARKYAKTWFAVDLIATIPYDRILVRGLYVWHALELMQLTPNAPDSAAKHQPSSSAGETPPFFAVPATHSAHATHETDEAPTTFGPVGGVRSVCRGCVASLHRPVCHGGTSDGTSAEIGCRAVA